jgi:hypothetical protein
MASLVQGKFNRRRRRNGKFVRRLFSRLHRVRRRVQHYQHNIAVARNFLANWIEQGMGIARERQRQWEHQQWEMRKAGQHKAWSWKDNRWHFYDGTHVWTKYGDEFWRCEYTWYRKYF